MNLVCLSLAAVLLIEDPQEASRPDPSSTRREVHQALLKRYYGQLEKGEKPSLDDLAPQFLKLAEENPEDFLGFNSLTFLVMNCDFDRPEFPRAMTLLSDHHARGNLVPDLLPRFVSPRFFGARSREVVKFLRDVIEANPRSGPRRASPSRNSSRTRPRSPARSAGPRGPASRAGLRASGERGTSLI